MLATVIRPLTYTGSMCILYGMMAVTLGNAETGQMVAGLIALMEGSFLLLFAQSLTYFGRKVR